MLGVAGLLPLRVEGVEVALEALTLELLPLEVALETDDEGLAVDELRVVAPLVVVLGRVSPLLIVLLPELGVEVERVDTDGRVVVVVVRALLVVLLELTPVRLLVTLDCDDVDGLVTLLRLLALLLELVVVLGRLTLLALLLVLRELDDVEVAGLAVALLRLLELVLIDDELVVRFAFVAAEDGFAVTLLRLLALLVLLALRPVFIVDEALRVVLDCEREVDIVAPFVLPVVLDCAVTETAESILPTSIALIMMFLIEVLITLKF